MRKLEKTVAEKSGSSEAKEVTQSAADAISKLFNQESINHSPMDRFKKS